MAPPHRIEAADSVLLVIDVQDALWPRVTPHRAQHEILQLVAVAAVLDIPVLVTEQNPGALGGTLAPVRQALGERYQPIAKQAFAAFDDEAFASAFRATRRHTAIVCGIESHICVLQTALAGVTRGYDTAVVRDACACHGAENHEAALGECARLGIGTPTAELVIYQWLRGAGTDAFRRALPSLKSGRAERPATTAERETR